MNSSSYSSERPPAGEAVPDRAPLRRLRLPLADKAGATETPDVGGDAPGVNGATGTGGAPGTEVDAPGVGGAPGTGTSLKK